MADEEPKEEDGLHTFTRATLIEKATEALLHLAVRRVERWLHEQERHRDGTARREFMERWHERFDEVLQPQEETDGPGQTEG